MRLNSLLVMAAMGLGVLYLMENEPQLVQTFIKEERAEYTKEQKEEMK